MLIESDATNMKWGLAYKPAKGLSSQPANWVDGPIKVLDLPTRALAGIVLSSYVD
jgi:hypothetical protein